MDLAARIDLYADGGVIGANPSADGGTWAYILVYGDDDIAFQTVSGLVLPDEIGVDKVTNNQTELIALINGLESLPIGWSGMVYSDSRVSLGRLFQGWALNNVPNLLVERAKQAKSRIGEVRFTLLDGHPTRKQLKEGKGKRGNPVSKWNVACDEQCKRLSRQFRDRK